MCYVYVLAAYFPIQAGIMCIVSVLCCVVGPTGYLGIGLADPQQCRTQNIGGICVGSVIDRYWPISKLLECIVAAQLTDYLKSTDLLPRLQSGFRPHHSTETATLRVLSDLLTAIDGGDVVALVLLDLSTAFDTVDHSILCRPLQSSFGLSGSPLQWFELYLHSRSQYVWRGQMRSAVKYLVCGILQGSVLGPILFIIYVADLVAVVERCGFCLHLYADDTLVYCSCRPPAVHDFQQRLSACLGDVATWMRTNRLQLNTNKTDLLWCFTARRQRQQPQLSELGHMSSVVSPLPWVRDLGIFIDADLSMRIQVQWTVASCFATLRQLRSGQSQRSSTSHLSLHLYWVGLTTATSRTLSISLTRWPAFTRCVLLSASSTS